MAPAFGGKGVLIYLVALSEELGSSHRAVSVDIFYASFCPGLQQISLTFFFLFDRYLSIACDTSSWTDFCLKGLRFFFSAQRGVLDFLYSICRGCRFESVFLTLHRPSAHYDGLQGGA